MTYTYRVLYYPILRNIRPTMLLSQIGGFSIEILRRALFVPQLLNLAIKVFYGNLLITEVLLHT